MYHGCSLKCFAWNSGIITRNDASTGSDNVGGVKFFLCALPRALRRGRHFALVE